MMPETATPPRTTMSVRGASTRVCAATRDQCSVHSVECHDDGLCGAADAAAMGLRRRYKRSGPCRVMHAAMPGLSVPGRSVSAHAKAHHVSDGATILHAAKSTVYILTSVTDLKTTLELHQNS